MNASAQLSIPFVPLDPSALDALMPFHVLFDRDCRIRTAGRSWSRMGLSGDIVGNKLDDIFTRRRAVAWSALDNPSMLVGRTMHLMLKEPPKTTFRGIVCPIASREPLWILNLSFGVNAARAVATHDLTIRDFAATDLTVELLYLVEAQSLARKSTDALISKLEKSQSEAVALSLTDPLTGLGNRRALQWAIERQIHRREGAGLIALDLDHFKELNDRLGHAAGDHILALVSRRLSEMLRPTDFLARVGGDEFMVLVPGEVEFKELTGFAERIIAHIGEPISFRGETYALGASAGCVRMPILTDESVMAMMEISDAALYAAKDKGRGRVDAVDFDERKMGEGKLRDRR